MVARRGTTNTNARGNNTTRKRRREAMVRNWRADVDVAPSVHLDGKLAAEDWNGDLYPVPLGEGVPACRCWRCPKLLTADTVTIDRWPVPGIDGGKYTATNTRPACGNCNQTTGATVRRGQSGQQEIVVVVDEILELPG